MSGFAEQVAWITGASSGIGAALARELSRRGAAIVLSGRDMARLEQVAKDLAGEHLILPFDVRDEAAMLKAMQDAIDWRDKVDVFIANAGVSQRSLAKDTATTVYRDIIEIDLLAQIAATQALLPHLIARRTGRLVFISSIAGKVGVPLRTAYCAAKHGLIGYADALRAELTPFDVAVHVVCPGSVATDVSRNALTGDGSRRGHSDSAIDNGIPPDEAAQEIVEGIAAGQREIIVARGPEQMLGEARRTPDAVFDQMARMMADGYTQKMQGER